MALDFRSLIFEGMARIPSYSSWLLQCDMEPAYRYHRRVLKLLQWRCPPDAAGGSRPRRTCTRSRRSTPSIPTPASS